MRTKVLRTTQQTYRQIRNIFKDRINLFTDLEVGGREEGGNVFNSLGGWEWEVGEEICSLQGEGISVE